MEAPDEAGNRSGASRISRSKQALSLAQSFDSRLPEDARVQSQTIEPAQRTAEDIAADAQRFAPDIRIDVQSLQNRRSLIIDGTALVGAHDATRPIDKLQIILQRHGNGGRARRRMIAKGQQPIGSDACVRRRRVVRRTQCSNPRIDRGELRRFVHFGNARANRIQVDVAIAVSNPASSNSAWDLNRPSQNRPVQSSSALARRAKYSLRQRMNQLTSISRAPQRSMMPNATDASGRYRRRAGDVAEPRAVGGECMPIV
jgi:hypothetical protein